MTKLTINRSSERKQELKKEYGRGFMACVIYLVEKKRKRKNLKLTDYPKGNKKWERKASKEKQISNGHSYKYLEHREYMENNNNDNNKPLVATRQNFHPHQYTSCLRKNSKWFWSFVHGRFRSPSDSFHRSQHHFPFPFVLIAQLSIFLLSLILRQVYTMIWIREQTTKIVMVMVFVVVLMMKVNQQQWQSLL